jgi:hypothetical protein
VADPLTVSAIGAVALTDDIKFLYGQAGEALKRWRERRSSGKADTVAPAEAQLPSSAFEGQLKDPAYNVEVVERLEHELGDLRAALNGYAEGIDEVDPPDWQLLETAGALRDAMEAILGQRITFQHEARPPPGPWPSVRSTWMRYMAIWLACAPVASSAAPPPGRVTAHTVSPGRRVVGLEAGTIGGTDERPSSAGAAGSDNPGADLK